LLRLRQNRNTLIVKNVKYKEMRKMKNCKKNNNSTEKLHNLIKKIAKGKKGGLEEFYDAYGSMIYIAAMSACHSKEKADEVVNTVLIKIWKSAKRLQDHEINEGWLYITTINCAKDKLEEETWLPLEENRVDERNEIDEMIDRESFISMIGGLSKAEQELLIYKFVQKMTFEEIAQKLDRPLSTVSSTYYRSLEKIKEKLIKNF